MKLGRRSWFDPPGGVLMWIIVSLELVTFSIVFVMIALMRTEHPTMFANGQRLLDPAFGLALTLMLLTSGWLVAEAVHAVRASHLERARAYYFFGLVFGLVFVVMKLFDFWAKLGTELSMDDDFGAAYILATGFHFAHVLVGLAMLTRVASKLGRRPFDDEETAVAGTGLFWHMCDLAWLFLFPLFFL
ncbi:MAG: cytochrome c oxidase subunit 3 [Myxococcales bacterium]|nr:cytochrome c oxidase subunit 3 [Myxococcales bacterium]